MQRLPANPSVWGGQAGQELEPSRPASAQGSLFCTSESLLAWTWPAAFGMRDDTEMSARSRPASRESALGKHGVISLSCTAPRCASETGSRALLF